MTNEEPLNGFTGFARRKPGFVPASVSVGRTPVTPASSAMGARSAAAGQSAATAQSTEEAFSDQGYRGRFAQGGDVRSTFDGSSSASGGGSAFGGGHSASSGSQPMFGGSQSAFGGSQSYPFSPASVNSVAKGALKFARDTERDAAGALHFDPEKLRTIPDADRRWSWVEVDLSAIRHNVMEYRRRLARSTRLMAIVKADAYGHGAVQVARTALNSGAEWLGVATVNEAIKLREALVNAPILILSEPPATAAPLLLAYKITPAVYTPEFAIAYAETADAFGIRAPYHLAVNTGMNRIGVRYDQVIEFMTQIGFHRALELTGVFTHFATADAAETLDFQIQAKRFIEAVSALRASGINPGIVHAANTAAGARFGDVHFDMTRLGISLYGLHASSETCGLLDLRPAMSVHARITDTRTVAVGEGVSYGLEYRSPGSVKICTIPVGYADGLRHELSGLTDVIVDGRRCRQVGQICMDMCMFEVDMRIYGTRRRLDPQIGDEVLLVGRQGDAEITLDEMAATLGTINYEMACGFGLRLPKVYK